RFDDAFVVLFHRLHAPPSHVSPLSLHDALPISPALLNSRLVGSDILGAVGVAGLVEKHLQGVFEAARLPGRDQDGNHSLVSHLGDRKSTRLNSSHVKISYAVFCLKKKSTTI